MINEKDLDTIIHDIAWSYEECGDKVPQNILDTLNEIKQIFKNQPTLDECIKEWKKRGWTYSKSKPFNWVIVEKNYKKIIFDGDEINYSCAKEFDIDLELHDLIHKTLKALENNNEAK